ncbi:hypothetical protein EK21DRAFT_54473 [Setomelanomma holmii]|uniref:Uncharacterized protein n=1 Tax=Setomelanomma holmii TaxID=210430 RepID=A0A9P4HJ75_9PLEO|nr:hypothetical protein EK21DRAFT_54473 [Setomelanomma holmii]
MRGRLVPIAAATTVLVLIILLFVTAPTTWRTTLWSRPRPPVFGHGPYRGWPDPLPLDPPSPKDAPEGNAAERLIIKVRLEKEDTSWIQKLEPTWQSEIIEVKPIYSHLHPKAHRPDKGRVANAYLRWIIENYHHLPETMVFVSPKDSDFTDPLDLSKAISKFQIPFLHGSGYANLRCSTQKSRTTCNNKALDPFKPPYELRTLEAKIPDIWKKLFGEHVRVPDRIATVLGAEFVVTRGQVQKRSADEYLNYWTWLNKTIMDDDSSGLVFEYLWHVVFGKDAIFCPERERCLCELYGQCEDA